MRKIVSLLAVLVLLTGFGTGYAQERTAPEDLSVYTTTDVVNAETTYKRYDMTFYEEPSTQPGTIVKLDYTTDVYGDTLNTWANVYLPYGYDENGTQRYNIIYFTHGTNETQDSLLGDERVKNALDNMIEVGVAEPFIMVCPTYYYDYETRGTDHQTFIQEVRKDLMPAVESKYRTYAETVDDAGFIASREHRAFSGYSQGGAVMWTLFTDMLDRAKWFLPFSGSFGSVYDDIKTTLAKYPQYADDFFVYLACGGKRDMAYENGNELINALLADDMFSYGLDPANNNLYYCLSKQIHQTLMSRYYFYNAFVDVLFK